MVRRIHEFEIDKDKLDNWFYRRDMTNENSTKLNELENKITAMLQDRASWTVGKYTFDHIGGVQLWISNGIDSLSVHAPKEYKFPSEMQYRIWVKIETMLGMSVEVAKYEKEAAEGAAKLAKDEADAQAALDSLTTAETLDQAAELAEVGV